MRVLGIDPGKSSGFAVISIDENRKIRPTGEFGVDKNESVGRISELLLTVDHVVIEDFLVLPKKARKGTFDYNNMVAPRVIGKIEMLCEIHQKPLVKQVSSLKPPAYGMANMKYVAGKKGTHWQDAYCHAVYFAVTKLHALPIKS